jgi:predicted dehydrogenase
MAQIRDACNRRVAVGYQWSWSNTIQALKADIAAGDFGRPVRLRNLVLWPRDESYYGRNHWAGQLKTTGGDWVLDSPLNNASSHYLHNCLYLLGTPPAGSVSPVDVQSELYRAKAITNYDTAALRAHTADGAEILFYTTHAVSMRNGPVINLEFEQATVRFPEGPDHHFVAHLRDGTVRDYGSPEDDRDHLLHKVATAIRRDARNYVSFPSFESIRGLS